jgi:hypothetical protein
MDDRHYYEVRGYPPGRSTNYNPRLTGYTLFSGVLPGSVEPAVADARRAKAPKSKRAAQAASERWSQSIPLTGKAIALAGGTLFVAGTPVTFPAADLHGAYEGRLGGILWAAATDTGEKIAETRLDAAPVWDGIAVAGGRLYVSLEDGAVVCLGNE